MKTPIDLKQRTKRFALDVIQFTESLPKTRTADVLGRQLLRAATSVGANYRAACRAKSPAHFISKMGDVEEESDECCYWFELLIEERLGDCLVAERLHGEANELLSITIASINTARRGQRPAPHSAFRTSHS
jgi:four helix bundle protein